MNWRLVPNFATLRPTFSTSKGVRYVAIKQKPLIQGFASLIVREHHLTGSKFVAYGFHHRTRFYLSPAPYLIEYLAGVQIKVLADWLKSGLCFIILLELLVGFEREVSLRNPRSRLIMVNVSNQINAKRHPADYRMALRLTQRSKKETRMSLFLCIVHLLTPCDYKQLNSIASADCEVL